MGWKTVATHCWFKDDRVVKNTMITCSLFDQERCVVFIDNIEKDWLNPHWHTGTTNPKVLEMTKSEFREKFKVTAFHQKNELGRYRTIGISRLEYYLKNAIRRTARFISPRINIFSDFAF